MPPRINLKNLAVRFEELFRGSDLGHGVYDLSRLTVTPEGKQKGKAVTVKGPYAIKDWEDHLNGTTGLGVVPIMADSNVWWGAIDIDRYDLDLLPILERLTDTPLVPTRSKSGGLHVFVFMSKPTAAGKVRKKLAALAKALGFGGVEVFPKQTTIRAEAGDLGQWLNMPYFDIHQTTRYGVRVDGGPLTAEEYLDLSFSKRLTAGELAKVGVVGVAKDDTAIVDGPPCLQTLTRIGFHHGTMNNGLFNLGVYYRKADPDGWERLVEEANQKWMKPGTATEVLAIIRSLRRKNYAYKCEEEPLCSHCDRDTCLDRKHGIGALAELEMPGLGSLTKLLSSPPTYFLSVNEIRVGPIGSQELLSQLSFQRVVFEALGIVTPLLKPGRWRAILNNLHEDVVEVEVPEDSSSLGQLREYLVAFITGPLTTEIRDHIMLGKVWVDDNCHHFRLRDLIQYLNRQKFMGFAPHELTAAFHNWEMENKGLRIKGSFVNVWVVRDIDRTTPIKPVRTEGPGDTY